MTAGQMRGDKAQKKRLRSVAGWFGDTQKGHSRVLGLWLPAVAPALSAPRDQKPGDAIVAGS